MANNQCSSEKEAMWPLMRLVVDPCACYMQSGKPRHALPPIAKPAIPVPEDDHINFSSSIFNEKYSTARFLVVDAWNRFARVSSEVTLNEFLKATEGLAQALGVRGEGSAWDVRILISAVVLTSSSVTPKLECFSGRPLIVLADLLMRHFNYFREEVTCSSPAPDTIKLFLRTFATAFAALEPKLRDACYEFACSTSASRSLRDDVERVVYSEGERVRELQEAQLLYRISELVKGEFKVQKSEFTVQDLHSFRLPAHLNHPVRGVAMLVERANANFENFLQSVLRFAPHGGVRPGSLHPKIDCALRTCTRSWFLAKRGLFYASVVQGLESAADTLWPHLKDVVRERGRNHASMWLWRLVVFNSIIADQKVVLGVDAPRSVWPIWKVCRKKLVRMEEAQRDQLKLQLVCPHRPMLYRMFSSMRNVLRRQYAAMDASFASVAGKHQKFFTEEKLIERCTLGKRKGALLFSLLAPLCEHSYREGKVTFETFSEALSSDLMWTQLWACKCCLYHDRRHLDLNDDLLMHVSTITNIIRSNFPAEFLSSIAFLPFKKKKDPNKPPKLPVIEQGPIEVDFGKSEEDDIASDVGIPQLHDGQDSVGSLSGASESEESDTEEVQTSEGDDARKKYPRTKSTWEIATECYEHLRRADKSSSAPRARISMSEAEALQDVGTIDPLEFFLQKHNVDFSLLRPARHKSPEPKTIASMPSLAPVPSGAFDPYGCERIPITLTDCDLHNIPEEHQESRSPKARKRTSRRAEQRTEIPGKRRPAVSTDSIGASIALSRTQVLPSLVKRNSEDVAARLKVSQKETLLLFSKLSPRKKRRASDNAI